MVGFMSRYKFVTPQNPFHGRPVAFMSKLIGDDLLSSGSSLIST